MTWEGVLAPVMVIGLMTILFLAIVTSEGVSRDARRGRRRLPPTQRDIEATGRLWRRRWRHVLPYQRMRPPPSTS
jgi:hypothetical protein